MSASTRTRTEQVASHRLAPITPDEITRAVAAVRQSGRLGERGWFETVTLAEPAKQDDGTGRHAFVCAHDPDRGMTMQGLVELAGGRLLRLDDLPGRQARITMDEFIEVGDWVRDHPLFRAALARRGIDDPSLVQVEPWAAGQFGHQEEQGRRLAFTHAWARLHEQDNVYGRPVAGLHLLVDLDRREVLAVKDLDDPPPLGPEPSNYRPGQAGPMRTDLKPLDIVQPDGPSFTVEGYHVRWADWSFHVGWSPREGLILYDLAWMDGPRKRPVMWRGAVSEMVVPYGSPSEGDYRRNAFDVGEYGIGQLADSLKLGCDCLGQIHYFDMTVHDLAGRPTVIEQAVCLHEEDDGILFKHTDLIGGVDVRRGRRLVVSFLVTVGNYVYGVYWSLKLDGTIACEVKATGIVFTSGMRGPGDLAYGTQVAPGVQAHVHQHVFNFRLDMDVDGSANRVRELDFAAAPPGPDNPFGNAILHEGRVFRREGEARGCIDLARARRWRVESAQASNRFGQPTAYELVPGANALPFLTEDSPIRQRAGFMDSHVWVTAFQPDELHAAGWYPNQNPGPDGLPVWQAQDRDLDGTDLVLWYTANLHHLPRPEDFPIQPVVRIGFELVPFGFFDRNPALNVPPASAGTCCGHGAG
ncbi:primary-amine oxidase [Geminicoccus roseus]|uniref:primary-amine oxidase n=1 Tax=Geminicoccus roseus TaxID=404900 RepID=UPI0004876B07|nr:primary-amine oxidase [Geminicoccus roseus]